MNYNSLQRAQKTKSLCILFGLGLIWGLQFSLARLIITAHVAPFGYAFWQALGPGLLLLLILLIKKDKLLLSGGHIFYYTFAAILSFLIPNTIIYFAALHIAAGIMAVIANTAPIFLYLLALIFRQENFILSRFIAVMFAFIGVMLITQMDRGISIKGMSHWIVLLLFSPLSYALATLFVAKYRPANTNSLVCATGMLLAGSIILIPFTLLTHSFVIFSLFNIKPVFGLILLSVFLVAFGNILVFELIKMAGAVYFTLVDSITAISGLLWSFLIFGNKFSPVVVLSVLLIIGAIIFMNHFNLSNRSQLSS